VIHGIIPHDHHLTAGDQVQVETTQECDEREHNALSIAHPNENFIQTAS
jgi:hypothetical protein